ncbi:MAG TPA: hypothetical protein VGX23_32480 [Actinocrinis sp.]|nr:hypothetical protein [Actinocrinis sp.]
MQLTAATLSVALVTAGAVAFGTHTVGATTGHTSSPVTAAATPTVMATDSDSMARWAVTALEHLLPASGKVSDLAGNGFTSHTGQPLGDSRLQSGTGPAGRFDVSFLYTSAYGSMHMSLGTREISPAYLPATLACPPAGLAPRDTCVLEHTGNGGTVIVHHAFNQSTNTAPPDWPTLDNWTATLVLPNGFALDLGEFDDTTPANATNPRTPALSAELLAAILTNPVWQQAEIGIAAPVNIPQAPLASFMEQMTPLKSSDPGFSSIDMGTWNAGLYYDGTSTTAVQEFETPAATTQARADLNCAYLESKAEVSSCTSTTLPDGTEILTTLGPLAPGSTLSSPTVYALHRDGSEEAAREYNAGAASGQGDPTANPALTTRQLQTLALQFQDPATR